MRRTKKWLEKERGQHLEDRLRECNQALGLKAREALEAMLVEALDSPGGGLRPLNPAQGGDRTPELELAAAAAAWAHQVAAALVLDPMSDLRARWAPEPLAGPELREDLVGPVVDPATSPADRAELPFPLLFRRLHGREKKQTSRQVSGRLWKRAGFWRL